ncbi:MAG: 1-acyl-sn-glycerol-3-phosphate acyltransferase [Paenibacillaceae bacterium]|nr:1-acyl-sn-glycerol-3-phosphate acyltransferase [Paenibacillaceae bacterium]
MPLYRSIRFLFKGMFKTFFRAEIVGIEHVPDHGAVILCSNHISLLDPPFVGSFLRRKVHFMAKEELFRIPGLGYIIRQLGAFPVKRGGVSKESIKLALSHLGEGHMLAIFPEGSRKNKGMGKKGAASLALKSGATVIPAAVVGKYKLFSRTSVVYGKPVDLSEFAGGNSEQLEAATEKIMSAIYGLLAEKKKQLSN